MALPRGAAAAQLPQPPLTEGAGQLLGKELASLVQRLRLFTPARWSAACPPWGTRADLVRHLAQSLADQAARCDREPHRTLPVLAPDLLLADQLAVTGDDLVRALAGCADGADPVAHVLLHRWDLLGEPPPVSLGGPQLLATGRAVCAATR